MNTIFAVMMCTAAPFYTVVGCQLSSWPSIYQTQEGCERQRDLMNGGYRTEPRNGLLYECWTKEVPAWRPAQ